MMDSWMISRLKFIGIIYIFRTFYNFRFFDAIVARERRRPLRFRHNYSYDIDKLEFLCPLCECISNTVIPMLPQLTTAAPDR